MTARRGATALAAGSALTGLLAYAVFAICTRTLGSEGAAPVSVLWTWWGLAGAALTFPVQHWLTRSVAAHGDASRVRRALPRLATLAAGIALAAGLAGWLLREDLFRRDDAVFPLLMGVLTLTSVVMGVTRGGLGGQRRFEAVAVTLVAENAVRLVGVASLALAGNDDPAAYGACILLGHGVALVFPSAFRFAGASAEAEPVLGFLSGAALGQLLSQVVLTGGPVLLAVSGGSAADVTILFAGLALFRAPYMVVVGMAASLTGRVTRLVVEGRRRELDRLRLALLAGTVALAAVAAGLGAGLGPWLVRSVFGDDIRLDATPAALLAAGSAVAIANLLLTIVVIAHGRPAFTASAWVAGSVLAAPTYAASLADLDRIALLFAAAETATFLVLLAVDAGLTRRLVATGQ